MAQTLYVKQPGGGQKAVTVLRSWQDASGQQIYLHANGTYGYKDAAPIRKVTEFDIIGNSVHKQLALSWWQRVGAKASAEYYGAAEEAERARAGDFQTGIAGDQSALDAILYTRRPAGAKKAQGEPCAWMELFPQRPDWWGQARRIDLLDYTYEMVVETAAQAVNEGGTAAETAATEDPGVPLADIGKTAGGAAPAADSLVGGF